MLVYWFYIYNSPQECRDLLDSTRPDLEKSIGLDASVHSAFYRTALEYHKVIVFWVPQGVFFHSFQLTPLIKSFQVKGPAADFYKQALLYLGYTPIDVIADNDQITLGSDVALAAILGDGIYNFGELVLNDYFNITSLYDIFTSF